MAEQPDVADRLDLTGLDIRVGTEQTTMALSGAVGGAGPYVWLLDCVESLAETTEVKPGTLRVAFEAMVFSGLTASLSHD